MTRFNYTLDVGEMADTGRVQELNYKGKRAKYRVLKVPLSQIYCNDQNGRIISWVSKYEEENKRLSDIADREEYNNLVSGFIREAEGKRSYEKTKTNIKNIGQDKPGVVLKDGRIIDGNRRFTCLRDLYEETKSDTYAYFDAVVLDETLDEQTEEGRKALKTLENRLQFGVEKEQEYNLVDRLLTIYKNCVSPRYFSDDEYFVQTNMSKKDFLNYKEASILMMDFLDFFNMHGKYFFVRQKNMGASFLELVKAKRKASSDKEWDRIKPAFYIKLLRTKGINESGITRAIRKFINDYIKTPSYIKDILKNSIDVMDRINDLITQPIPVDPVTLQSTINTDSEIGQKLDKHEAEVRETININKTRTYPIEMCEKALAKLNDIEIELIKYMKAEEKSKLLKCLNEIQRITEKCLNEIDNND